MWTIPIRAAWIKHSVAIELLKHRLALKARARRNGRWLQIPLRELVSGDVARIRLGDIIPADIKLMQGDYLLVDESALTGESLPIEKRISDIGYSSSIIRQGEMDALVVTTGMNTFFGRTAKGYCSLGVSGTDEQGNWKYAGIIAIYDAPSEDSAEIIKTAQSFGVNVKMVTGDHIAIARQIASQVNLGTNIITASGKRAHCGYDRGWGK